MLPIQRVQPADYPDFSEFCRSIDEHEEQELKISLPEQPAQEPEEPEEPEEADEEADEPAEEAPADDDAALLMSLHSAGGKGGAVPRGARSPEFPLIFLPVRGILLQQLRATSTFLPGGVIVAKIGACLLVFLVGALPAAVCDGSEPMLKHPVKVPAGGVDLDVGSYSIPKVWDWDNDGRKDLIVGQATGGYVRLYLNSGTDAAPVFTTFTYIQADGANIAVPTTGCQGAGPEVVDWNSDEMKDLLVGDSYGHVTLFLNVGTDAAPALTEIGHVQVGGVDYSALARAIPCVNDWDEDTCKDLLVGRGDGQISVLINTNTDDDPVFGFDDRVYASGSPLDAGLRVAPEVFDWNGDGLKDLLAGEGNGGILFYENIGTNAAPAFDSTKVFLKAGGTPISLLSRSRVDVADWNNDGLADIIAGASDGCVYFIEQTLEPMGDVDGNGIVDGLDLTAVLTAWETTPGDPLWNEDADLDGNGIVDGLDLTEVISYWTAGAAAPGVTSDSDTTTTPGHGHLNKAKGNVHRK